MTYTEVNLEGEEREEYIRQRFGRIMQSQPKPQEVTTTDLADFGARERWMLIELLTAWDKQGLPDNFYDEEVRPMMNRNSGCVFLTNSEYQTAMMNGDDLEIWHNCWNCGHEGFAEDCQIREDGEGCNQCNEKEKE